MLWRTALDTVLLARTIKSSKCLLQARNKAQKITEQGKRIMKLRKEDNMFFGKLIETKKEKVRRLKKGYTPKALKSPVDSEFSWCLNNSIRITQFKSKCAQVLPEIEIHKENIHTNSNSNLETENVPGTEIAQRRTIHTTTSCDKKVTKIEESTEESAKEEDLEESSNTNEETDKPPRIILPDDIAQKLLEFPIMIENSKTLNDKWTEESEILTVTQVQEKDHLKFPSVTKILTATMSEESKTALEKWKQRLIEKYGPRGFEIYQRELLTEGKALHVAVMRKLNNKPYTVPDVVQRSFNSLENVFKSIDNVKALESHVVHPKLLYRGIMDCVAVYRGDLCLIDWKKSDAAKKSIKSTYDAPIQIASYIGALNADSNYPFQIKKGVVVVAYTSGNPATVYELDEEALLKYWKLWLQRLKDYHAASNPC